MKTIYCISNPLLCFFFFSLFHYFSIKLFKTQGLLAISSVPSPIFFTDFCLQCSCSSFFLKFSIHFSLRRFSQKFSNLNFPSLYRSYSSFQRFKLPLMSPLTQIRSRPSHPTSTLVLLFLTHVGISELQLWSSFSFSLSKIPSLIRYLFLKFFSWFQILLVSTLTLISFSFLFLFI